MDKIKVHITKNWMQNVLSRMLDFGQTEFDAALREKPDGSIVLSVQFAGDRILPLYMGVEPVAVLKVGGKFVPDPDAAIKERAAKEARAREEITEVLPSGSTLKTMSCSAEIAPDNHVETVIIDEAPAVPVVTPVPAPKPAQPKAVEQKKKKATEGEE